MGITKERKTIRLSCFKIEVTEHPSGAFSITSELHEENPNPDGSDDPYNYAVDGVEALILAHAQAGIDIASHAYIEGIETAFDAISNHVYGE